MINSRSNIHKRSYKNTREGHNRDEESETREIKLKIIDVEKEEKYYSDHPEEHALYRKEWEAYWERKYDELKSDGIDPENYDFTPEWSAYFRKFLREHYEYLINELKRRYDSSSKRSITLYDDVSSSSSDDDFGRNKRMRNYRSSDLISISSTQDVKESSVADDDSTTSVTFVYVLRILSVLENDLGSILSNKVLDLLSMSLELERVKPNSSDELLMTRDNIVFLETCKEKLKGLLIVELLSSKKIVAVKKCIQSIAQLIHQTPVSEEQEVIFDPERQKIADMIEKEVAAHGKNDLSRLELDVLVDVYLEAKQAQHEEKVAKCYENLTNEDLKCLIRSFPELVDEEQKALSNFLRCLEVKNPARIELLKKDLDIEEEPVQKLIDSSSDDEYFNETYEDIFKRINSKIQYS